MRANQRDGRKIFYGVVRKLFVDARVDRAGANVRHENRVTVGRCLGHLLIGDDSICAGPILHHNGLLQRCLQAFGYEPGKNVGGSARRIRNHKCDGLGGEGVGDRRRRKNGGASE